MIPEMWWLVIMYINFIAFVLFAVDKDLAIRETWWQIQSAFRKSPNFGWLLLAVVVAGFPGAIAAMLLCAITRHPRASSCSSWPSAQ
jgi:uncharacterized membrane protein YsdA (DUF1294 family)